MHTKFERLLSKSLTTLEVMSYYLVVHTGPEEERSHSNITQLPPEMTVFIVDLRDPVTISSAGLSLSNDNLFLPLKNEFAQAV